MAKMNIIWLIAIIGIGLLLFNGEKDAKKTASAIVSNPNEDGTYLQIYDTRWVGQTFTPTTSFTLTGIVLMLEPSYDLSNVYLEIHDSTGNLMTGQLTWQDALPQQKLAHEVPMNATQLNAGTEYTIYMTSWADNSQGQHINVYKSDSNPYANGVAHDDSWGTRQTLTSSDLYFVIMGDTIPTGDSCSDTDGGVVYGTQGTVSGTLSDTPYSYTDYCTGDVLTEYACVGDVSQTNTYTCPDGCLNGVCQAACSTTWQDFINTANQWISC